MMVAAMKSFKQDFKALKNQTNAEQDGQRTALQRYYQKQFLPHLNKNIETASLLHDFFPDDGASIALQTLYMSKNPHPVGEKHLLDRADDTSDYSKTHADYHPTLRNHLEKFGYYDIFLVDNTTRYVVYSVYKEVDYATSLIKGPHRMSNIAAVYESV